MCDFFSFPPKCKTFQKGICNACHIFPYTSYWPDKSWEPWEHRCHCIQTTLITLGFLQPQCLHVTVDYDCSCSLQWGHFAHENSETQKLWDRPFSPLLFSRRIWEKKNSWHINFIQHFAFEPCFGNIFLSKVSVLCFSVQWNLLSICSLTFLYNLLHDFVFKLHGKFLYVAYSLREALIVIWVFRKWQCKTINMYDVFFWRAI